MSCLLDTSFLVRLANRDDALHSQAVAALTELLRRNEMLVITAQNLVEFWSVATRPVGSTNGLGLSAVQTAEIIDVFGREFFLAPETPDVFPTLRKLLDSVEVIGKQVHDARLVAVCFSQGISSLVTFNPRHLSRFAAIPPGLNIIEPAFLIAKQR